MTITLHFLMHGVHHLLPMDPMRLVFPPVLTCVLLCPIHATFRSEGAGAWGVRVGETRG